MGAVGTAEAVYGSQPSIQPSNLPGVQAAPAGAAAPGRTEARPGFGLHNPTLWLVLMLGLAIGLIHFSVRLGK